MRRSWNNYPAQLTSHDGEAGGDSRGRICSGARARIDSGCPTISRATLKEQEEGGISAGTQASGHGVIVCGTQSRVLIS